jgi:PAS domain S-box-containing protein
VQSSLLRKLAPYAVAIATTTIAFLLTLWLEPLFSRTIAALFFLAVTVTTFYGGIKPGLVAIALSTLALHYVFVSPRSSMVVSTPEDILRLIVFIAVALVINIVTSNLQRSKEKIAQLNQQLLQERDTQLQKAHSEKLQLEAERKQAQTQLYLSQERLHHLLSTSPAVIYSCQPAGDYGATFVGENAKTMLGYESQDFIGNSGFWAERIHPEDAPRIFADLVHLFEGGHHTHEYRFQHHDGSYRWVRDECRLIRDDNGQPLEIVGYWIDISDRKKTEEALQISQQRLNDILNSIEDVVWSVSKTTDETLYVNPTVERMYGRPAQDFLENSNLWQDCVYADDLPIVIRGNQSLEVTGSKILEYRIVRPDGTIRWISDRARYIYDEGGQRLRIDGIASDITERKQAEILLQQAKAELEVRVVERTAALVQQTQILQEAERRWRTLLENVQLAVVGLDRSGNVEYVNPFFLKMTGYSEPEVMGKLWFTEFIPPSQIQESRSIFQEILRHGFHPYYQNTILTKTGEERIMAWNNTLLQDQEGNVVGTMSIGEDITQRQIVDRMKNEFISIVSHELRTPLTAIRGSLGLMASGTLDGKPDKSKQLVHIAAEQSDRLVRLVNDILDLRRLESGKVNFSLKSCDAAWLMAQVVAAMRSSAEDHQLSLQVAATSVQVLADTDAVLQILTNLVSNAIKFSPPHSTISLSASLENSTIDGTRPLVRFAISDQGRGIPVGMAEQIFDPFQQVDASDSRDVGGTGLGLAICRKIVQQHGGQIWVESILGQGSTFYFTLPSALD